MLKILQATIIPVLLCANLLGDEYGVEKWPKLIKGVSWGMSPEVAKKAMKKAGHRFVEESSITEKRLQPYTPFAGPKIGQKLQRIVLIEKGRNQIYGGKYFGLGTDFYFSFDSDDGLVEILSDIDVLYHESTFLETHQELAKLTNFSIHATVRKTKDINLVKNYIGEKKNSIKEKGFRSVFAGTGARVLHCGWNTCFVFGALHLFETRELVKY